jgi:[protein-PII] uridylyltransferase
MVNELKNLRKTKKTGAFVLKYKEDEPGNNWILTFVAMDRPGLFSDMAGVLAMSNINILSADIYTWGDGTVVDIFRVTNPLDNINPERTWNRIKQDIGNTLRGKLSLPYRLNKKSQPTLFSSENRSTRPTKIVVDNGSSDFFTLIEVFSDDRIGLLYLITRTLFDLRLDIRVAKIGTKGDQIADVFYVRDLEGQKVEDAAQVEEIKGALLHELSRN